MSKADLGMVLLVTAYLTLAGSYSVTTPAWEAPDEPAHFEYVRRLAIDQALPIHQPKAYDEMLQPPLYYATAAPAAALADLADPAGSFRQNPKFVWGYGGDVAVGLHGTSETFPYTGQALGLHLARLVSVLFGALAVAMTISCGRTLFPDQPQVGLLAGSLVAFNPQFLFIGGVVSNDVATAGAAALAWRSLFHGLAQPSRPWRWVILGACAALAFLAKASAVALIFVVVSAIALRLVREGSLRNALERAILTALPFLVIAGWWIGRNLIEYGDATGVSQWVESNAYMLRQLPLDWSDLRNFLRMQFISFWGLFGWANLPAPDWFYIGPLGLSVAGAAGVIRWARGRRYLSTLQVDATLLLLVGLLAQEAFLVAAITRLPDAWYQGRLLFAGMCPIALLLALGCTALVTARRATLLAAAVSAAAFAGAVFSLLGVIRPAYSFVSLPQSALAQVPQQMDVPFGDVAVLRGYGMSPALEGQGSTITLYWQALRPADFDYSAFVHVVDGSGRLIAQRDAVPGDPQGFRPTAWGRGDLMADPHVVDVPFTRLAQLTVATGLYNWQTGQRLPAGNGREGPPADSVILRL